jgi:hypothetical protein
MPERASRERPRADREELVEEARRATADPADRAEMQAVMKDMEAVGADWPDEGEDAPRED